jgi:exopolyphosphatase/pppGpp-phosphohydrolase
MKLCPDRLHTITTGFLALRAIAARTEVRHICLSRYGVREGYLIEKVWGQEGL